MSLEAILALLFSRKWLLMGASITACIATLAASFLIEPTYRAQATLSLSDSASGSGVSKMLEQLGGLGAIAGLALPDSSSQKKVWLATLTSRQFAASFIADKDLLPVLFPRKWDERTQRWKSNDPDIVPSMDDAVRLFEDSVLSVTQDRKTDLITLSVDWRDRIVAAQWANELVVRVNDLLRARAIRESEDSLSYLKEELKKTDAIGLQQAIYRIIEGNINKIMMANVDREYAFKVIDPATAPDAERRLRPKRVLLSIVGALAGLFLAIMAVLTRSVLVNQGASAMK